MNSDITFLQDLSDQVKQLKELFENQLIINQKLQQENDQLKKENMVSFKNQYLIIHFMMINIYSTKTLILCSKGPNQAAAPN